MRTTRCAAFFMATAGPLSPDADRRPFRSDFFTFAARLPHLRRFSSPPAARCGPRTRPADQHLRPSLICPATGEPAAQLRCRSLSPAFFARGSGAAVRPQAPGNRNVCFLCVGRRSRRSRRRADLASFRQLRLRLLQRQHELGRTASAERTRHPRRRQFRIHRPEPAARRQRDVAVGQIPHHHDEVKTINRERS